MVTVPALMFGSNARTFGISGRVSARPGKITTQAPIEILVENDLDVMQREEVGREKLREWRSPVPASRWEILGENPRWNHRPPSDFCGSLIQSYLSLCRIPLCLALRLALFQLPTTGRL
jgi:hypothetical protein